jgi:hypothetical protein
MIIGRRNEQGELEENEGYILLARSSFAHLFNSCGHSLSPKDVHQPFPLRKDGNLCLELTYPPYLVQPSPTAFRFLSTTTPHQHKVLDLAKRDNHVQDRQGPRQIFRPPFLPQIAPCSYCLAFDFRITQPRMQDLYPDCACHTLRRLRAHPDGGCGCCS